MITLHNKCRFFVQCCHHGRSSCLLPCSPLLTNGGVVCPQVWLYRISLLIKLRQYSHAESECQAFGSMDTPDLYYEYYYELYPGRRGRLILLPCWVEGSNFHLSDAGKGLISPWTIRKISLFLEKFVGESPSLHINFHSTASHPQSFLFSKRLKICLYMYLVHKFHLKKVLVQSIDSVLEIRTFLPSFAPRKCQKLASNWAISE